MSMQEFFEMLQYLLITNSIDIIIGNFNYFLLKVPGNKLLDISTDHAQMENKPLHICRSLMDHVYINKPWWKNFPQKLLLKTFIFNFCCSADKMAIRKDNL